MKAMTNTALLGTMKAERVEVRPANKAGEEYEFAIADHPFGYLDKHGNLYLDTYEELVSRPLSIGSRVITRWINWAAKGFRINLRRLAKW